MQHVTQIAGTPVEDYSSLLGTGSETIRGAHALFKSEEKVNNRQSAVLETLNHLSVKTDLSIGVAWNQLVKPIYKDVIGDSVGAAEQQPVYNFVIKRINKALPSELDVRFLDSGAESRLADDSQFEDSTLAGYLNPAIIFDDSYYLGTLRVVFDVPSATEVSWPFTNPSKTALTACVVSLDDCDVDFVPFPTDNAWSVNSGATVPYPVTDSLSTVADGLIASATTVPRSSLVPLDDALSFSRPASVLQSGLRHQPAQEVVAQPTGENQQVDDDEDVAILSGPSSYVDELFVPHDAWAVQEQPETDYVAIYVSGQTNAITHIACIQEKFTESAYLEAIGADSTDVSWAASEAADNERLVLKFSHIEELDTPVSLAGNPAVAGKLGQVTYTEVETIREAGEITDIPVFQLTSSTP